MTTTTQDRPASRVGTLVDAGGGTVRDAVCDTAGDDPHHLSAATAGGLRMRVAGRTQDSIVDGPGLRYVVFAQGCELACTGCHNVATQPLAGGEDIPVPTLIAEMRDNPLLTGLTLSGGEPTRQPAAAAHLAEAARHDGLDVWCYSGYRVEALLRHSRHVPQLARLLAAIDVLVDGPFVIARRSLTLPWRGSTNQRLVDIPATLAAGRAVELSS